jgi:hypothetical protein
MKSIIYVVFLIKLVLELPRFLRKCFPFTDTSDGLVLSQMNSMHKSFCKSLCIRF